MKILLASDVTIRGGVDGYVLDLAAALTQSGHHVVAVLEETTASSLPAAVAGLGIEVRLAAQYHRRHTRENIARASAGLLADLAPDGLHVACGSPFSCLGLRETAGAAGLPAVVTEQLVRDGLTLDRQDVARIRSSYHQARRVIFVSEGNRATMDQLIGLDQVAHLVIPNGVDVERIRVRAQAVPRRTQPGGARLMAAARFAPDKGLDILVRAIAELPAALVARLDVYGEGPEREPLRQLIADTGLTGRVMLHPWADDLVAQMAAHDLLVLPSKAEGMPYVVLEAMAAGIPVVATAVAGTAEALGCGDAGTLVPHHHATALAAAIRGCLTNREATAVRTRVAASRVAALYNTTLQMSRTVALWES